MARSDLMSSSHGKEQTIREGSYSIEWYEGTKRIRVAVGKNAADAQNARLAKQAELHALENGVDVPNAPVMSNGQAKHSLAAAIASYLEDIKLSKKHRTHLAYKTALEYFQESCHKQFVEEIDRRDMLKFSAYLRDDKDQSPRSVYQQVRKRDGVPQAHGHDQPTRRERGLSDRWSTRTTGPGSLKRNRKFTSGRKSHNSSTPANRMSGYGSSSF
jgi:hypothetical protein